MKVHFMKITPLLSQVTWNIELYLDVPPQYTSPLLQPGTNVLFTLIIALCVFIIYHNDTIIAYYRSPLSSPPPPSLIEVETDHKCDNIDCMLRGNGVGFIVEF